MSKTAQVKKNIKATKPAKKTTEEKATKPKTSRVMKHKPYLEFITAFLSIPVLITVMLINFQTLKNFGAKPTPTPSITQAGFYAQPIDSEGATPTIAKINQGPCEKGLGPVKIATPGEGDTVSDNPIVVSINYDDSKYCGAAWSYRINGGSWSGYDDRSVALYNLPSGQVKFELRVKSIVTSDEVNLTRTFTYNNKGTILIPTSASSSDSAR